MKDHTPRPPSITSTLTLKARALAQRKKAENAHLIRTTVDRQQYNQPFQTEEQAGMQTYHNFSSNDYLGLSQHPTIHTTLTKTAQTYGVGSGASHLVTGHCAVHTELEQALSSWLGREKTLLFSTGYMANLAVFSSLLSRHDTVLQDKLNHASLIDAGILSRAKNKRYPHLDSTSAHKHLKKIPIALLATDGVFSMEGSIAPLDTLAPLCAQHGTALMVDDAHGLGVLGATGKGVCEHLNLNSTDVPILMGTLGKAFGTFGAFVSGDTWLIDHLQQHARPYIYTTALPPAIAGASLAALHLIQTETWRIQQLQSLIAYFQQQCHAHQLPCLPSQTAIHSIIIGDPRQALLLSTQLKQHGFWVTAIRPPTVPANTARLRITLSATMQESHIDQLIALLARFVPH